MYCFRAKEGDSVLDLCCGSGDLAFLLSEKVGPCGKVFNPSSSFYLFIYLLILNISSTKNGVPLNL